MIQRGSKVTTERHSATGKKSDKASAVLLQTAQVWAEGHQRRTLARLLFDGSSQRTFVTRELSHELQLEVVGEEDVTIYAFGRTGNIIKGKRKRVRIWLRSQYNRKEHSVEALEIPEIRTDQLILPENAVQEAKAKISELDENWH